MNIFMIGLEKNQDIVKLAAYAPLFENVFPERKLFGDVKKDGEKVILKIVYIAEKTVVLIDEER